MPHISIKSYPKGLTKQQLTAFADDISKLASKWLNTPENFVSVAYTTVPESEWKEKVFDPEVKAKKETLIRIPQYGMPEYEI